MEYVCERVPDCLFSRRLQITLAGIPTEIVQVPNPQDSRVLRVYVTKDDVSGQRLSLAFEFYGCKTSSGGPTGQLFGCFLRFSAVFLSLAFLFL